MKIKFSQEELILFGGFLKYSTVAMQGSRDQRRATEILARKFMPNALYVTLKQTQRDFALRFVAILDKALKRRLEELKTEEELALKPRIENELELTQRVFQKLSNGG